MPLRHRFRPVLLSVLAALILGVCGAVPAQAAEKGLVPDLTWGITDVEQDRTGPLMADVGAQWARINISWQWVNPEPGVFDEKVWAHYDRGIATARKAGAKVILMVDQAPSWASGSTNRGAPPQDPKDYADFMRVITRRYADVADAWEIWNEPNHPTGRFWYPAPDPAAYAALLKEAYPAVKRHDPTAPVLFGGVVYNDYKFLEAAYAAIPDLGKYFDVMATHPYSEPLNAPPEWSEQTADGRMSIYSFPAYREVRNTMAAHGDVKPIWFTEFGWATYSSPTGGVTESQQADYLWRAYKYIEQDPYVQVAIYYNFRNNYWGADGDNWEDSLGLMKVDFSPKPAYWAFKLVGSGMEYQTTSSSTDTTTATTATTEPTSATSDPAQSTDTTTTTTTTQAPPISAARKTAPKRTKRAKSRTRIVLRLAGVRIARRSARVRSSAIVRRRARLHVRGDVRRGRSARVRSGRVVVRVRRGVGRRWKNVARTVTRVDRQGRFSAVVRPSRKGRYLVRAHYAGNATKAPARSRAVTFVVH